MKQLFALLLFSLLLGCNQETSDAFDGKVVSIADGDTFTMLTPDNKQVKVRLHGIDCPERAQPFGNVARQKLSDLAFGQQVQIDEMDKDRYGRTVAIAYNENGVCINKQMLKEGLAWHYKEYDDNPEWTAIEKQARQQKVGLWSQRNPTPPWNWRKVKRTQMSN
jgi:endonuclease YncB( thermonuclease family)